MPRQYYEAMLKERQIGCLPSFAYSKIDFSADRYKPPGICIYPMKIWEAAPYRIIGAAFPICICRWPYSTLLPGPGRQQTASRESHPSEDLSELPPQSGFSLGRSIITRLLMRVGLVRSQPQCKTARHRLLFGRMGTAQHLNWPSLMQILSAQVVLAHPPVSLQPPFRGSFSSADVSRCRIFSFQRLMKCHHS